MNLGTRMKYYEGCFDATLPKRMPLIIRLDGKSFHTVTKDCVKPFDTRFYTSMVEASLELFKQVQTTVLAYSQSDEISLLLHNYKRLASEAWYRNRVQKMVSIAASIASVEFSRCFGKGYFDARAFVLPESEVCNYFIWRQWDASNNSLLGLAQKHFSHEELHKKTKAMMHEMLYEKGINWNSIPTVQRRGFCIVNNNVDTEIPIFNVERGYIEKHLAIEVEHA